MVLARQLNSQTYFRITSPSICPVPCLHHCSQVGFVPDRKRTDQTASTACSGTNLHAAKAVAWVQDHQDCSSA